MNAPFQTPSGVGTITDPNPVGERLYCRSTDAADTMGLTMNGSIGVVTINNETVTLAGLLEKPSSLLYDQLIGFKLASVAAGKVSVYGQGVAAQGTLIFETVPADGDQIEIELAGGIGTNTFTFRVPPVDSVTITGISAGDYNRFDFTSPATALDPFVVYFEVDGSAVGGPPVGGTQIVCNVLSADTNAQKAVKLAAAINGASSPFSDWFAAYIDPSTPTKVFWVSKVLGTGALLGFGAGFSYTEEKTGTTAAADQLRTGYAMSGTPAVPGDMGQSFNGLSATLVTASFSGSSVTLTDKIACNRQLNWNINQPVGTGISIVQPIGGVDGQQLAAIGSGELSIFDPITLDKIANPGGTLPGLVTFTSDWIVVSGSNADLWVSCDNVVTPITAKYQTTIDPSLSGGSARDGETSLAAIDNNIQRISIPERCEAIRFVITANANPLTSLLDARLLFAT